MSSYLEIPIVTGGSADLMAVTTKCSNRQKIKLYRFAQGSQVGAGTNYKHTLT